MDILLLFAASWFILVGVVVVDVNNQVFPPPTQTERTEAYVQGGAAFVAGFTLLAMALLRSRRDGWRVIVFRRIPGVVLVAMAFTAIVAGMSASYFGGAIAFLIAVVAAVGLLAVSTRLLRVR